jgi:hypothetical protein
MPSELLKSLMEQTRSLGKLELQIKAKGYYPTGKRIAVQKVAKWQNDGNDRGVKPSDFVERAARSKRYWEVPLQKAVGKWLSGNERELSKVGQKMAQDINKKVDRIDTGRLRESFISLIMKDIR